MSQNTYQACLIQISQDPRLGQTNKVYLVSPENSTVVGRAVSCEVTIDSSQYQSVSRRHAEIRPLTSQTAEGCPMWQLCDLESVNGTYINGQLLQGCQTLEPGDRISLGRTGPLFIFDWQVNYRKTYVTNTLKVGPPQTDSVHLTQLIPILSSQQDLLEKAYLVPGLITVLVVIGLFASIGDPDFFNGLLGLYLAGACFYYVYRLGGKHKPWWLLLGSALITISIITSPVVYYFIWLFRDVLPGKIDTTDLENMSFFTLFVRMFFGAGLMEELLKAIPVFIFLMLGRMLKSPWREAIGVWEPLDGILIATASAAGFTLIETVFQYVPDIVQTLTIDGNPTQKAQEVGIQLLIPRIIGAVAGHMAYSGYFGYFIGFSVLRPKKRWLLLAIGYLSASSIHALWNASNAFEEPWNIMVLALAGVFAYLFLVAAIIKARQISPTRAQNFATRLGRSPNNW